MLGDFMIQFFVSPIIGNVLMALFLSLIVITDASNIKKISGSYVALPLALLASSFYCILTFDNSWSLSGVIAYFLASIATKIQLSLLDFRIRFTWTVFSTILLYILGGSVAFLFSIMTLIIEMKFAKRYLFFWFLLLLYAAMMYMSLKKGIYGNWQQAITPACYYDNREDIKMIIWIPWLSSVFSIIVSKIISKYSYILSFKAKLSCFYIMMIAFVIAIFVSFNMSIVRSEELFKEFSTLSRDNNWDGIIDRCSGRPSKDIYVQSIINEAWAEKNQLGDHLFDNPQADKNSLLPSEVSTAYIAAQLSDIYFSMGHISLAQLYAFEANEHIGHISPRLLMRLVETNMIYGEKAVAKKYLCYLRQTLFYKRWAENQMKILDKEALNYELNNKLKCILKDNRLRGVFFVEDDLRQIVRQNPAHTTSVQYLVALSIFIGTEYNFKPMINELIRLNAIPLPLQRDYQRVYNMIN